jgi:hypothetical protein
VEDDADGSKAVERLHTISEEAAEFGRMVGRGER